MLASCGKGGAEIVVDPKGLAIDRVVLYAGAGTAHTDGLGPDGYTTPILPSTWWQRDAHNVLDEATVKDGRAVTFAYTPGADGRLELVVAVGFAADAPLGVALQGPIIVSSDAIARYTLPLQPVDAGIALQLWSASTDPAATCVHVDDGTHVAMLVADATDPDCDGVPSGDPRECDPQVYNAHVNSPIDKVNCILPETNTSIPACVFGGPQCSDGKGLVDGCIHSNYCVPQALCNVCMGSTTLPFDCVTAPANNAGTNFTHFDCPIQVDANGQLCGKTLAAAPFLQQPPSCTGKARILYPGQPVDDQIAIAGNAGALQVKLANLAPSCAFELEVSGTWPYMVDRVAGLLVVGDFTNQRGVAVPVFLSYDPTPSMCDKTECAFVSNPADGLAECIHAPTY